MGSVGTLTVEDLAAVSECFETEPATAVVRWAVDTFGERLCLTASMADAVLIDVATSVEPGIEVVFLDTQYHFPETLATAELVRERYQLNLRVLRPDLPLDDRWRTDTDGCCAARKVAQLDTALEGRDAWMSGLRRAEAESRAGAAIIGRDGRGKVKINPLATWSDDDVARYVLEHDVPVNPLLAQGYPSIGCWPCTQQVADGDDPRSGRWAGLGKTECGLHL